MNNQTLKSDLIQIEKIYISALEAYAVHYKHISGVTLFHLETKDPHKTFSFSFRTLPKDDTGVCHIIEHSVCVASKKYPLRDTFMALDQGSVNTTLNACTYKDMTTYYGASLYEEDLLNMMEVYLDLLFNPLMLDNPAIFRQEGWDVQEDEEGLSFTGIVYNEMAGEYTEGSAFLEYEIHKALFPDTHYQYDSGGVPESIITLTNETFIAYYKAHYTPAQMTCVLYGDVDLEKVCIKLSALSPQKQVESESILQQIPSQKAFTTPSVVNTVYPVACKEGASSFLALAFVLEECITSEMKLACMMLEHMLLKSAASPLTKVLVEQEKLGISLGDSGYDTGKKQPTFSIVLQGVKENNGEKFERLVMNCLRKLAKEGIPKALKEAAFHQITFSQYEAEWDGEIAGLVYSEWIQLAHMYTDKPFMLLNYEEGLRAIEMQKDSRYFETLIQKLFLHNTHRVTLSLLPSVRAYDEINRRMDDKLDECIGAGTHRVLKKKWWDEKSQNQLLPQFDQSKLKLNKCYTSYQYEKRDETKLVISEAETKGIAYIQLLFDGRCIEEQDIPYVGLLAHLLTYIRTKHYTYEQLENQINQVTGTLNCGVNSYSKEIGSNRYKPYFKLGFKVLAEGEEKWFDVLKSILTETKFDEKNRMKDLISTICYDYEKNFAMAPEYRAVKRVYSYFSPIGIYEDLTSGFAFYQLVKQIDNDWEMQYEVVQSKLKTIYEKLIRRNNLTIGITTSKKHQENIVKSLEKLKDILPYGACDTKAYALQLNSPNEAFTLTSQVQAIAKGYDFTKRGRRFHGSMYVVAHLLNTQYLWDTIRLEGGAYGADVSFTRDGSVVLVSYCDPQLIETLALFDEIGDYLEKVVLSKEAINRLIIGTIGQMDYPLSNEEQSEQVMTRFLCDLTEERLQKEREEVLKTDLIAIRQVASIFKEMAHEGTYCVIGNKERIEASKKYFTNIHYGL